MSAQPPDDVGSGAAGEPSPEAVYEALQNADLDAGCGFLADEARAWAAQLRRCADLAVRAEQCGREGDRRFLVLELAGSWRISQLTAARWIDDAERLRDALPATLALLGQGGLYAHQARVLLHRTRHCPLEVARRVEAVVLPEAVGLCPSDLSRRVERAVLQIESEQASGQAGPDSAEQRHLTAAAARRVWTRAEPDAMALIGAVLTAEQQVAFSSALEVLERRERCADRRAGIIRTADQRRADLFAALPAMVLTGTGLDAAARADARAGAGSAAAGATDSTSPTVDGPWTFGPQQLAATVVLNVHVPVSTVLEVSGAPGTLDGYGPVSAEHVRLLRPTAYRRVLVEGRTGRPIAVDDRTSPADPDPGRAREQVHTMLRPDVVVDTDEPQHDPPARLARLIDLRDVHCTGPGCSSTRTHRDHHDPWPSGPTNARNLGRLSARCHAAKHHGWTLHHHPDGSSTWTSPLHRTYTRPSPHCPPPQVDPYAEPPPPRHRPPPAPPTWVTTAQPPPPAPAPATAPPGTPEQHDDDTPPF